MKSSCTILLAVILALLGAIGVRQVIVNQIESEKAELELREIVEAAVPINEGATITEDMLQKGRCMKANVGNYYTWEQRHQVVGRQAFRFIDSGTPVLKAIVEIAQEAPRGPAIPSQLRLYSLDVSTTAGVSGLLVAGDYVDVIFTRSVETRGQRSTMTQLLLHYVKIYKIGPTVGRSSSGAMVRTGYQYRTVTLLVTPREAELLAFARKEGELHLVERHFSSKPGRNGDPYRSRGVSSGNFGDALRDVRAEEARRIDLYKNRIR